MQCLCRCVRHKSGNQADDNGARVIYTIGPSYTDINRIWIGTDDGIIATTADGGLHWTDVTPKQIGSYWKVFMIEPGRFVVAQAGALVTRVLNVKRNGKKVDAVAQITKFGYVYVLDRRTGKPLFPIGFRKAPASALDGEKLATEQPYPLQPPPFTRQSFTEDMITNRTPEAHRAVLDIFRQNDAGNMFAPPSLRGSIRFPGVDGGGEWGGAAYDEASGLLFVNANEQPWIIRMVTQDTTSLYNNNCASCHKADRTGTPPSFPSLVDIGKRRTRQELIAIINQGTGRMPAFDHLGRGVSEIVEFLLTGKDSGAANLVNASKDPNWQKYRNEGYILMRDQEGYPPLTPPWKLGP